MTDIKEFEAFVWTINSRMNDLRNELINKKYECYKAYKDNEASVIQAQIKIHDKTRKIMFDCLDELKKENNQ